jgi:hypothetical protein
MRFQASCVVTGGGLMVCAVIALFAVPGSAIVPRARLRSGGAAGALDRSRRADLHPVTSDAVTVDPADDDEVPVDRSFGLPPSVGGPSSIAHGELFVADSMLEPAWILRSCGSGTDPPPRAAACFRSKRGTAERRA